MIEKSEILQFVQQAIEGSDKYIVDVKISSSNQITVYIDSIDGVSIEDCKDVSKFIESQLNRDEEDFELEVSSAGLSEPFKVLQQYIKNIGNDVEVLFTSGQKSSGELMSATEEYIVLKVKKRIKPEGAKRPKEVIEDIQINMMDVKSVKLVLKF